MFTLQTMPAYGDDPFGAAVGKAAGFSLHAGVAAASDERDKQDKAPARGVLPEPGAPPISHR